MLFSTWHGLVSLHCQFNLIRMKSGCISDSTIINPEMCRQAARCLHMLQAENMYLQCFIPKYFFSCKMQIIMTAWQDETEWS